MKTEKRKIKGQTKILAVVFCFLPFVFYSLPDNCFGQQLPYYTQFKQNNIMLNPGVTGTKRAVDLRFNYRNQWVGFESAPVTKSISLNSRFNKGIMGLGISYFQDETGPTQRQNFSAAYSYHVRAEDVELSLAVAVNRLSYIVNGTELNMHIPQDNAIDLLQQQSKKVYDASAGAYFYNDRFHVGLSMLNLLEATINYYPESDTVHKTNIHMVPHSFGSMGYNWSGQPDWIWENSLQLFYAVANPLTIDYNLRLHYKQKVFAGISLRIRDAIAFHIGASVANDFNISYSYDWVTSPVRTGQSGSHEIMLIWSSNLGMEKKKKYNITQFKRQKYGYMF